MKSTKVFAIASLFLLVGCAGWQRDCNSYTATQLGADWIVTQVAYDGKVFNCWKLTNTGITNETASDGIFWQDGQDLVHVSGWYNRVQVDHSDFKRAAAKIGVDVDRCKDGRYESEPIPVPATK